MTFPLRFLPGAENSYRALERSPQDAGVFGQVRKALGFLEANPRHPSLRTHEYASLKGPNGERVFEAYAQNNTPGAYRIFFCYSHEKVAGKKTSVIKIIAITPHP